jgi:hypothetical protein
MQEAVVFILFFGVIAYFAYSHFSKRNSTGCSSCEFNEETN